MSGPVDLPRRLACEALGTAFLLATVVGSGIMAADLAGGNRALALLCNTIPTGAILIVLILMFGPVSGAHLNPAVTLAFFLRRDIRPMAALAYIGAQTAGGILGVVTAHVMFDQVLIQTASIARPGPHQWLSEAVATFGLVAAILGTLRWRAQAVPFAVGLYITAAYWFTASTSFANPAVTVGRTLTDSFSGIAPLSAPGFVAAQLIGTVLAVLLFRWLLRPAGIRPDRYDIRRPAREDAA